MHAAGEELRQVQAGLAEAGQQEREARRREAAARRRQERALKARERRRSAVAAWGLLQRLPCQWLIALVAGLSGAVGVLGPLAAYRGFLAVAGSTTGGLLLASSVSYFAAAAHDRLGPHATDEPCLWDVAQCLLNGSGFTSGYMLWVTLLALGMLRWFKGFECALYAVVDEVHMCKPPMGGCHVTVPKEASCIVDAGEDDEETEDTDEEGAEQYLVDNSKLRSTAPFLAYRSSKKMEDKDSSLMVAYGSTVRGLDEGDGWLRVGRHYLPMTVRGVPVLVLKPKEAVVHVEEDPRNLEQEARPAPQATPAGATSGAGTEAGIMAGTGQVEFEEFARFAREFRRDCAGAEIDRAVLLDAWECSNHDLGRAVEIVLQIPVQAPQASGTGPRRF